MYQRGWKAREMAAKQLRAARTIPSGIREQRRKLLEQRDLEFYGEPESPPEAEVAVEAAFEPIVTDPVEPVADPVEAAPEPVVELEKRGRKAKA